MKHLLSTIFASLVSLALVVPVMALVLPIAAFVYACDLVRRRLVARDVTDWNAIIRFDPVVGWKPRALLNNVKYADPVGDIGTISTDQSGWPLRVPLEESDTVVFGDSFAFGFGSRLENAYFSIDPGLRIKPVAAPSYNMVQALMLMREHRDELRQKLIFWFVCLENDLVENLKPYNSKNYTNPFVSNSGAGGEWVIHGGHLEEKQWLYQQGTDNTLAFADICTGSPYAGRVRGSLEYLIREARQLCDSVGSRLVIFTIPDKRQLSAAGIEDLKSRLHDSSNFDEDFPDRMLRAVCDELGVQVICGREHLSVTDYKTRDPHWTGSGNRKVGRMLTEYYRTDYASTGAEWSTPSEKVA